MYSSPKRTTYLGDRKALLINALSPFEDGVRVGNVPRVEAREAVAGEGGGGVGGIRVASDRSVSNASSRSKQSLVDTANRDPM